MKRYELDYCEFYITNVCNLNCPECNRFNNHIFRGHFKWEEHKEEYAKWAEIVDLKRIRIMGGEPFTNKDLVNWINGLRELWPDASLGILTNGTLFKQMLDLYDICKDKEVKLRVSWHNSDWTKILDFKDKYLKGKVIDQAPEGDEGVDYIDSNGVIMEINPGVSFYNNMLDISDTDIKLAGNMSDAQQAFNACSMKFCHHFFRGKIFKCGPMTTLPMFMEQYRVTLTEEQEELLNAYRPASPDWDEDRLDAFFQNLNGKKPIDQCALCRERFERKPDFEASTQKIPLLNFKL